MKNLTTTAPYGSGWERFIPSGPTCAGLIFAAAIAVFTLAAPAFVVPPPLPVESDAPLPPNATLSAEDAARYRAIFALQDKADWAAADQLIAELDNDLLLGHVLAQRYLHPTDYRANYGELSWWLARYADLPDAWRIHGLALKRKRAGQPWPQSPVAKDNSLHEGADPPPAYVSAKPRSRAADRRARRVKAQIRRYLYRVRLSSTERLLKQRRVRNLLDPMEMDSAYANLAAGWFYYGKVEKAYGLAQDIAGRRGKTIPVSHWIAGLAAWRMGDYRAAAEHFERVADSPAASPWNRAAGAYWAARAHGNIPNPEATRLWLTAAAAYPRTFYGILARQRLHQPQGLDFSPPRLGDSQIRSLLAYPEGARALALLRVGQTERAEQELMWFDDWDAPKVAEPILAFAVYADFPSLGVRLAERINADGEEDRLVPDAAAYPIPSWTRHGEFRLDRALLLAFMRQESAFDPDALSPDGARGLMQLMPRTAASIDRHRSFRGRGRDALHDPEINIELGQRYLARLLSSRAVRNNLLRLAAAYNAGPGNLMSWGRRMGKIDDPLLFIESIPRLQTRLFVERVLTNLWIYRLRLGQRAPSLEALAAERWPQYRSLDRTDGDFIAAKDAPSATD